MAQLSTTGGEAGEGDDGPMRGGEYGDVDDGGGVYGGGSATDE